MPLYLCLSYTKLFPMNTHERTNEPTNERLNMRTDFVKLHLIKLINVNIQYYC